MGIDCKFIFNPEHDLCLASGDVNFIPPATAVRFAQEGKWIERFMRLPEGMACGDAENCAARIVPWGWNAVLKHKLIGEGYPQEELPSDSYLEFIRKNSRRELADELHNFLNGKLAGEILSAEYRIVAQSVNEIEQFLQQKGKVVLKAPLSGSGKGIRFVTGELMDTDRGWCKRTLQKQGAVIVEQRMDIQQEFAMLFEYTPEKIAFRGYSLFYANNGAYKGNILASNEYIENMLAGLVSRNVLNNVRGGIEGWLQEKLQGNYTGFIGVDQFICIHNGTIMYNPVMEINLRMTMGLIARNIYDYHKEEYNLEDGTHSFEPERGICKL